MRRLQGHKRVAAGRSGCLGSVVCLLNSLVLVGLGLCQRGLKVHGLLEHGLRYAAVVTGLARLFERGARTVTLAEDPVQFTEGRGERAGGFSVGSYRRLVGLLCKGEAAGQVVETSKVGGGDRGFPGGGLGGVACLGKRLFGLGDLALLLLDGGVMLFDRSHRGPLQFVLYVRRAQDLATLGRHHGRNCSGACRGTCCDNCDSGVQALSEHDPVYVAKFLETHLVYSVC